MSFRDELIFGDDFWRPYRQELVKMAKHARKAADEFEVWATNNLIWIAYVHPALSMSSAIIAVAKPQETNYSQAYFIRANDFHSLLKVVRPTFSTAKCEMKSDWVDPVKLSLRNFLPFSPHLQYRDGISYRLCLYEASCRAIIDFDNPDNESLQGLEEAIFSVAKQINNCNHHKPLESYLQDWHNKYMSYDK